MTSPMDPPQAGAAVEIIDGANAVERILARTSDKLQALSPHATGSDSVTLRQFRRQLDDYATRLEQSGGMGMYGLLRQVELLAAQVGIFEEHLEQGRVRHSGLSGLGGVGALPPQVSRKGFAAGFLGLSAGVLLVWMATSRSERFRGATTAR